MRARAKEIKQRLIDSWREWAQYDFAWIERAIWRIGVFYGSRTAECRKTYWVAKFEEDGLVARDKDGLPLAGYDDIEQAYEQAKADMAIVTGYAMKNPPEWWDKGRVEPNLYALIDLACDDMLEGVIALAENYLDSKDKEGSTND